MKFEEFVRFVLDEGLRKKRRLDIHWRPQYRLCQPCHINYDFVGHYETIRRDSEHVIRQIARHSNINTGIRLPASDVGVRNKNSREFLRQFYGNVSLPNIRQLLRLYRKDYETFGFEIPENIR